MSDTIIGFDLHRRLAGGPLYYGWVVVGACFLLGVITSGTIFSFGVFFGYIAEEFGLSHANTSVVFSLQTFVTFSGAAIIGFVIDRYGARRFLVLAGGLVVVGLYGVSQLGSFVGLLLSYGLVAATGFAVKEVVVMATPSRWFDRRRGVATGIAGAGVGLGVFVFPPIVEFLIRHLGWRGAYGGLMLAFLATYVVAALVISDRPSDLDLTPAREFPTGIPEDASSGEDWRSQIRDAIVVVRNPAFGLMFLGTLFLGTTVYVIVVSIVEFTVNVGLDRTIGVLAISVMGLMNVTGKIVGGKVSDRVGRPSTFASSSLFQGVGVAMLLVLQKPAGVLAAAVVFGFGWGIGAALLAPVVADLFGTLNINTLVGLILGTAAISGSLGPYLAGLTFDHFGTYRPAFLVAAMISVIGGGLVLVANRLESHGSRRTST